MAEIKKIYIYTSRNNNNLTHGWFAGPRRFIGTVLFGEVSDEVSRRESVRVSWRNLAWYDKCVFNNALKLLDATNDTGEEIANYRWKTAVWLHIWDAPLPEPCTLLGAEVASGAPPPIVWCWSKKWLLWWSQVPPPIWKNKKELKKQRQKCTWNQRFLSNLELWGLIGI